MTTKGFMRGNYIFDLDGKSILKIETVSPYYVFARTLDGEFLYELNLSQLKPISINDELLIKFGCSTKGRGWYKIYGW